MGNVQGLCEDAIKGSLHHGQARRRGPDRIGVVQHGYNAAHHHP